MPKESKLIDVIPGKSEVKRFPDKDNPDQWKTKVKAEYVAQLEDSELIVTFKGNRKVWRQFEKNMNIRTPKHFFKIQLFPSEVTNLDDVKLSNDI